MPPDPAPADAELSTPRLLLRRWRDADRAPFARLNADPVVMEQFPATISRAQTDTLVDRIPQTFETPFTPAVEVGWRLAAHAWGHGYATEAATACLDHAFETLDLPEVVSMTAVINLRSVVVMQRLGMTRDPADDFDHPRVPEGHRLRRHVLYRVTADRWGR